MAALRPRTFVNWAGTASCRAAHSSSPRNEGELRSAIAEAAACGQRIKLVGAGHSWNDCACTPEHLVSLDAMDHFVAAAGDEVTVEGGMRLWQLNEELHRRGLALGVVGSIAHQTVAGAISTGTHGSSPRRGNLASMVTRLRLALADGTIVDCSRAQDPELFAAARVGLGALGVITQVTLRCEPAFTLEENASPMRFDEALAAIPRLAAEEEYVKLWWLPHTDFVQVFRYRRTSEKSAFSKLARWVDEKIVNRGVFALLLWLTSKWPRAIPAMNRAVRGAYFRPARRIARSDRALTLAMPARHEEVEIALPVEYAAEALVRTRDLIEREKLRVNFVVELRFVAADDAWLSPCHGRDSCFIGAYMARSRGIERYFSTFESEMLALGGRPHWGKQFSAGAEQLAPLYSKWDDFDALRARLDPRGMFENDYVRRLFGRTVTSPAASASALPARSSLAR
jgi:L-gulonolactone oxidase